MAHGPCRESVEVLAAPAALHAAFVCAVVRTIDDGVPSDALPAWVQANPYACFNVVTAGQVHAGPRRLPACFLAGPMSVPLLTRAGAGLRSVSVVFQPWLLAPLFGIAPAQTVDRILDVAQLEQPLLAGWREHALRLQAGAVPSHVFWQAMAAGLPRLASMPLLLQLDVLRSDGVASAAARAGYSPRQYRRRFQHHMGLAPSAWLRVTRWEQALRQMAAGPGPGAAGFGELAASAGYADQAHMTRETRSLAAESPAALRKALREGQASWSLRPARGRSVQDRD